MQRKENCKFTSHTVARDAKWRLSWRKTIRFVRLSEYLMNNVSKKRVFGADSLQEQQKWVLFLLIGKEC